MKRKDIEFESIETDENSLEIIIKNIHLINRNSFDFIGISLRMVLINVIDEEMR